MSVKDIFGVYLPMYIVPAISIFLSYYFGLKTKNKDTKQEALKLRYEKLYEPFLRLTVESWPHVKIASSFPEDLREDFMNLFQNNVGQLGLDSLNYYPQLYESYLFYLQKEKGNQLYKDADITFNKHFMEFGNLLVKECSAIREELQYPEISETFSEAYSSRFYDIK